MNSRGYDLIEVILTWMKSWLLLEHVCEAEGVNSNFLSCSSRPSKSGIDSFPVFICVISFLIL